MMACRPKRLRGAAADSQAHMSWIKLQTEKAIHQCNAGRDRNGFTVKKINNYIGRGVFTTQSFRKQEFLLEYAGDLINYKESMKRENVYTEKEGNFMYYFKYHNKTMCVDATLDPFDLRKGRLVNDGIQGEENCKMVVVAVGGTPHLCLFASRDLRAGEELRYDYGVAHLPWRKKENPNGPKTGPDKKDTWQTPAANHPANTNQAPVDTFQAHGSGLAVNIHNPSNTSLLLDSNRSPSNTTVDLPQPLDINQAQDPDHAPETDNAVCTSRSVDSTQPMDSYQAQDPDHAPETDNAVCTSRSVDSTQPMDSNQDPDQGPETDNAVCTSPSVDSTQPVDTNQAQDPDQAPETDNAVRTSRSVDSTQPMDTNQAQNPEQAPETDNAVRTSRSVDSTQPMDTNQAQDPDQAPETDNAVRTSRSVDSTQPMDTNQAKDPDQGPETDNAVCTSPSVDSTQPVDTNQAQDPDQAPETDNAVRTSRSVDSTQPMDTNQAQNPEQAPEIDNAVRTSRSVDSTQPMDTNQAQDPDQAPETDNAVRTSRSVDSTQPMDTNQDRDPDHAPETDNAVRTSQSDDSIQPMDTNQAQNPEQAPETDNAVCTSRSVDSTQPMHSNQAQDSDHAPGTDNAVCTSPSVDSTQPVDTNQAQDPDQAPETDNAVRTSQSDDSTQPVDTNQAQDPDKAAETDTAVCTSWSVDSTHPMDSYQAQDPDHVPETDNVVCTSRSVDSTQPVDTNQAQDPDKAAETDNAVCTSRSVDSTQPMYSYQAQDPDHVPETDNAVCTSRSVDSTQPVDTNQAQDPDKAAETDNAVCTSPSVDSTQPVDANQAQDPDQAPETDNAVCTSPSVDSTQPVDTNQAQDPDKAAETDNTVCTSPSVDSTQPVDTNQAQHLDRTLEACNAVCTSQTLDTSCIFDIQENCATGTAQKTDSALSADRHKNCVFDPMNRTIPGDASRIQMFTDSEDSCDEVVYQSFDVSDNDDDASAVVRDPDHQNVCVSAVLKSSFKGKGKALKKKKNCRVFNKNSSCLFCQTLSTNISKHYIRHHKDEPKVAKILNMKSESYPKKDVKKEWDLLRNQGNHSHNLLVNASKSGELLGVRRKESQNFSIHDYTPCPRCKGWYLKSALTIRVNMRCVLRQKEHLTTSTIQRKSHLHKYNAKMEKLDSEVFLTMHKDTLTKTARRDPIIRRVGSFYLQKHQRNKMRRKNFASKHMRQAAKLLVKLNENSGSQKDLSSYLTPQKFNEVQRAAIELSGGEHDSYDALTHPSTLKNLGYEIKHYVEIKEELAIERQDIQEVNQCKYFLKLYKRRWALLSSSAIKQLEERQYNSEVRLPSSEDIKVVTDFIKNSLEELTKENSSSSIQENYKEFVELIQARLIMFNKRRPGEVEALTLEDFAKHGNNDHVLSEEVSKTFTKLQHHLLKSHRVVTVRGKRGRAVPILIPADCFKSMLKLSSKDLRKNAGVKSSNPYLFANTGDEVFRCVQSLQHVLERADCGHLCQLVKASNLRKYLATNCQLLNLNDSELDWITRHLGHTKLTHLNNYRLSSSTIERTKIAKLLVIMENGLLGDAQGSSLSNEELDEVILKKTRVPREEEPDLIDESLAAAENCTSANEPSAHEPSSQSGDDGSYRSSTPERCSLRYNVSLQADCIDKNLAAAENCTSTNEASSQSDDDEYVPCSDQDETTEEEQEQDEPPKTTPKVLPRRRNRVWTEEVVHILEEEFRVNLGNDTYPSFSQIRRVQRKYPLWLGGRSEAQIKAKLMHLKGLQKKLLFLFVLMTSCSIHNSRNEEFRRKIRITPSRRKRDDYAHM